MKQPMADMPQAQAAPFPAGTPVKKFMFERSFDIGAAARPVERKPVTLKAEQLDQLKQEAFDAGVAAGRKQAAEDQDKQLTALLARVEERIGHAIAHMEPLHKHMDSQLRHLALAITGRMLPDFLAKHGTGEIQALLGEVIGEMAHEPRLVVRIHDTQFDEINARVQDITAQKAYAGKVVVLADTDLAAGDCRVEWADGGIERKTDATWAEIKHIVTPPADNLSSASDAAPT